MHIVSSKIPSDQHILRPTKLPSPIHGFRRGALSLTPGAWKIRTYTFAEALCDRVETPYIGNGHPTFDSKLGNPCNGYLTYYL